VAGLGVGDFDFRGFSRELFGFDGNGLVPTRRKDRSPAGAASDSSTAGAGLVPDFDLDRAFFIRDDGEFEFFRRLGWSRRPRG